MVAVVTGVADSPELARRAAVYLGVRLELDLAPWRRARAGEPAGVSRLEGDLRLAGHALGHLLRLRPTGGVDLAELIARRWALGWLVEAAEQVAGGAAGGGCGLVAAAASARGLIEEASGLLGRLDPCVTASAQANAVLVITTAEQVVSAWRREVLHGAGLGRDGGAGGLAATTAGATVVEAVVA